jgi:hypothetical protein
MEKALEASGRGPLEILSWYLPGVTGENDKIPHLGYLES